MTVVLDSWALLRYLEDEGTAADAVADLLDAERPIVSWINLGEVFYVVRRRIGEDRSEVLDGDGCHGTASSGPIQNHLDVIVRR